MSTDITHDRAARRFETTVEGALCELAYQLDDRVMTITHTGVPARVGGRGLAAALVEKALATARSEGWKVVPACSYAEVWMRRHPDFDDLRA
jgi:predicted GNAT family acetyltransferase